MNIFEYGTVWNDYVILCIRIEYKYMLILLIPRGFFFFGKKKIISLSSLIFSIDILQ